MKKIISLCFVLIFLVSCGVKSPKLLSTTINSKESSLAFQPIENVSDYSKNTKYGLSGEFPVKVGKKSASEQRKYLASLAGPKGEVLQFHRKGSCCPYKSENSFMGSALVDVYEVTYYGLKKPILIYISFYDFEKLYVPKGFTKRIK